MPDEPILLPDGPVIRVSGPAGKVYEVKRERMLHARTRRRRRVWAARRVGVLAWDLANTPRRALAGAAFVPAGRRPGWLATAVADVAARYPESGAEGGPASGQHGTYAEHFAHMMRRVDETPRGERTAVGNHARDRAALDDSSHGQEEGRSDG